MSDFVELVASLSLSTVSVFQGVPVFSLNNSESFEFEPSHTMEIGDKFHFSSLSVFSTLTDAQFAKALNQSLGFPSMGIFSVGKNQALLNTPFLLLGNYAFRPISLDYKVSGSPDGIQARMAGVFGLSDPDLVSVNKMSVTVLLSGTRN